MNVPYSTPFKPPLQVSDQTRHEDVHREANIQLPSLSRQASSPSLHYFNNPTSPTFERHPSGSSVGSPGSGVSATPTSDPFALAYVVPTAPLRPEWSRREPSQSMVSQPQPSSCEENAVSGHVSTFDQHQPSCEENTSCHGSILNTNESYQNEENFPNGLQAKMTPYQECGAVPSGDARSPRDRNLLCLTKSEMMRGCNKGEQIVSRNQTVVNPVQEAKQQASNGLYYHAQYEASSSKIAQETEMLKSSQKSELEGQASEQTSRKRKMPEERVTRSTVKKQRSSSKEFSKNDKKSSKSWLSSVFGGLFRSKVSNEEPGTDSEEYETCDEDDTERD